jgi:hypothetical protein
VNDDKNKSDLGTVQETLLIPLWARATACLSAFHLEIAFFSDYQFFAMPSGWRSPNWEPCNHHSINTRMNLSNVPEALCLSVSPHLQVFDRPLLQSLAKHITIAQWEYQQMPDEPCSFDIALALLHDYLKQRDCPIHLIGHGISGLLALLCAQRHPAHVRSLEFQTAVHFKRSIKRSPTRKALAITVKPGLTLAWEGKKLLSTT